MGKPQLQGLLTPGHLDASRTKPFGLPFNSRAEEDGMAWAFSMGATVPTTRPSDAAFCLNVPLVCDPVSVFWDIDFYSSVGLPMESAVPSKNETPGRSVGLPTEAWMNSTFCSDSVELQKNELLNEFLSVFRSRHTGRSLAILSLLLSFS